MQSKPGGCRSGETRIILNEDENLMDNCIVSSGRIDEDSGEGQSPGSVNGLSYWKESCRRRMRSP